MDDIVINSNKYRRKENERNKDCCGNWNCINLVNVLVGGSSIQAVSQVDQANSKGCKTYWLVVLFLCMCSCIFQVNNFLSIYFQFPVLIDVQVKNNGSLEFPAVTVCNLNRMKRFHTDCVKKELKWNECDGSIIKLIPRLLISERKKHTAISNSTTDQERNYKYKAQEFFYHYTSIDVSSRKCYGHRLHELVRKCAFNSVVCNHEDFTYFNSMQYGNCFTFNKKFKGNQEPLEVRNTGSSSGLELDIELQPSSYLDTTEATGSRVVIHNPDEDPNPGEHGINICPGYETQVSMAKTSVYRLPPPYRDRCKEYRAFDGNDTSTGSQFDCIRTCMQWTSMSFCGCVDPFFPVLQGMVRCNLKNTTQMVCLDEILEGLSVNGLPCECPLPCKSTTYNLQLSTAILSSSMDSDDFGRGKDPACEYRLTQFHGGIFKRSASLHGSKPMHSEHLNRVRRSNSVKSAKLKVFYGSLKHTIYAQKPMFSESELYGQLGGNLSFWLGLSVVAMFEYAEKLFLLIHFCWSKKKV